MRYLTLTNLAAIRKFILGDSPQARVPSAANRIAVRLAPRLPITLHNRPYTGVNVEVARRYLGIDMVRILPCKGMGNPYAVPSQLT